MKCTETGCDGNIENGFCQICGAPAQDEQVAKEQATRRKSIATVRNLLHPREVSPSRDDLAKAAETLKTVVPYNYEAWRLHADLLLTALRQVTNRSLQADAGFTLFTIPLRENDLRDAAEDTLRECAHFADSDEKKIALVDEANRVRRLTWF
jgi:hypothetical protein